MILQKGARLGPYEVEARLGAGGMGEVYRARDTRLSRQVAIKILPPQFAANARLKVRFEREAKAISALSDPHICALYDVGSNDGLEFLVMEYCEGVTLSERLSSGAMDAEQALRYGVQIASALERAHAAGVIHRDVKPANVMVTRSGVKLLDFGLAAASSNTIAGSDDSTRVRDLTGEGQIVGTLMYMAPEVLRGATADERSDVYALGLLLYEMLTGERPFTAADRASLIAKIIGEQPRPMAEARPGIQPAIEKFVRACLAKNPDDRIQSAHDAKLRLQWILESSVEAGTPVLRGTPSRRLRLAAGATAAVIGAAAIAWLTIPSRSHQETTATVILRSTIDLRGSPPLAIGKFVPKLGYLSPLIAVSPDGRSIVYVGVAGDTTQLFVRRTDQFGIVPIAGTEGAHHAFFSPDGQWIAFFAGDRVQKVRTAGGAPIALAEIVEPIRGVWRTDAIYVMAAQGVGLYRMSESGQSPLKLSDNGPFVSDVLPDGRHIFVRGAQKASGDFDSTYIVDLKTGEKRTLIDRGYDARYIDPGFVAFARGGELHIVGFDLAKLETVGEPSVIERDVAMESFWGQAQYAISSSGTLAFVPGGDRSIGRLAWVDRSGSVEFLDMPARRYGVFTLSPAGDRLATEISDVHDSIAIFDFARRETKLLRIAGDVRRPEWTADGRLVFSLADDEQKTRSVVSTDAAGEGMRTLLSDPNASLLHVTTSLDGQTVVVHRGGGGMAPAVHVFTLGSASAPVILEGGGVSSISPDNRWLAFVSRKHARQIFVSPVAAPRSAQQVSTEGGGEPMWCRRCPDLFYRNGARFLAARFTFGDTLRWDPPRLVWATEYVDTPGRSFDVSPDGNRLLVSKRVTPDSTDRIQFIQDWRALVHQAIVH